MLCVEACSDREGDLVWTRGIVSTRARAGKGVMETRGNRWGLREIYSVGFVPWGGSFGDDGVGW